MAIDELNGKIRVYNYSKSPVGFPSNHNINGVFIRGCNDDEEYVVERVDFDDIETENTKSDLFKVGRLRFHPDEEDEIYKRLGIDDRENILTDLEIMDKLRNDSIETIKWISNLRSNTLALRLKQLLFHMERSGKHPSPRIAMVVNERVNELKFGLRRDANSTISRLLEEEEKRQEENQLTKTLDELKKKVQQLEKEKEEKDELLNQSQNAIKDLLEMVNQLKGNVAPTQEKTEQSEPKKEVKKETTKKAGRPTTKKN